MKTKLISIVGDDVFGNQILEYLKSEQVDTSLIQVQANAHSAVTGVITLDTGASMAIGWKNEQQLFFPSEVLANAPRRDAIRNSDFFLASFELPSGTVGKGLLIAKDAGQVTTIVTPAPPYDGQFLDHATHGYIDYLVANIWELGHLARAVPVQDEVGLQNLANKLLFSSGIRNLAVTHNQACHAYLRSPASEKKMDPLLVRSTPNKMHESPGDRDAFCAMLAFQLHQLKAGGSLPNAIHWATAAMCCVRDELGVPNSMPTLQTVKDLVERFVTLPD